MKKGISDVYTLPASETTEQPYSNSTAETKKVFDAALEIMAQAQPQAQA